MAYNIDHLTDNEVVQVAAACYDEWQELLKNNDPHSEEMLELMEEMQFWTQEAERRKGYEQTP